MKIILFLASLFCMTLLDNFNDAAPKPIEQKHSCRWALCPYKEVTPDDYKKAVAEYTGAEEETDAFHIDMLHLQFPDEDYDQLEERLTTWGGEPMPEHFTYDSLTDKP